MSITVDEAMNEINLLRSRLQTAINNCFIHAPNRVIAIDPVTDFYKRNTTHEKFVKVSHTDAGGIYVYTIHTGNRGIKTYTLDVLDLYDLCKMLEVIEYNS